MLGRNIQTARSSLTFLCPQLSANLPSNLYLQSSHWSSAGLAVPAATTADCRHSHSEKLTSLSRGRGAPPGLQTFHLGLSITIVRGLKLFRPPFQPRTGESFNQEHQKIHNQHYGIFHVKRSSFIGKLNLVLIQI